ncbi:MULTISPECIES: hypothetical protein [Corynebacterium]|jgi:hypothetical protein|uniref:Uncharacterized protein n=1 Tax=Corynebacterium provencense TaxID=1737425 RepID=A0A2Z3YT14_9CORY|nr:MULTISPECIES: hypothetical protein [Corynebacterium]AWT25177.1 hypothetical protein Csp1_03510 [Corynebacterium provencense]MCI1255565.1 hypothetical protein [Corynebacterium provencense]
MDMSLKKAEDVNTSALVGLGLVGGWLTARETGIRPLGTIPMVAALGWANRSWVAKGGAPLAVGLTGAFIGAFGLSHPLAKKIGAWPSVIAVTTAAAGAAHFLSDAK